VNARQGLLDLQTKLQNRGEHAGPEPVQKMQARLLKKIAVEVFAQAKFSLLQVSCCHFPAGGLESFFSAAASLGREIGRVAASRESAMPR